MTLEKIRYFIEIARCGSFSEAAARLYVSQPNLSRQIAALEEETGVALFARTKRRVALTPAGKLLYEELKDVPDQVIAAFRRARELAGSASSVLSIGIMGMQDMGACLLPSLERFSVQQPGTEIRLERAGFARLRAGLRNGLYDAIVTMRFDIEDAEDFVMKPLLSCPAHLAVPKRSPLASRENLSFAELKNEDFVLISAAESPLGEQHFFKECTAFGFTPRLRQRPDSLESLLLCVEAGIGAALLDSNVRLSANSGVRLIPVTDVDNVEFVLVWRRERASAALDTLIALTGGQESEYREENEYET